ncbi:MAG: poly-gamma-glutamate hydrolase family protein [Streptomycetaceae bacterium]|nr:poly-gamma-glutamate hydrolase family protein [Streptomycetaceae bacterium]
MTGEQGGNRSRRLTRRHALILGAIGVTGATAGTAALLTGAAQGADTTPRDDDGEAGGDMYPTNTALYADPSLREGRDWARRYRKHAVFDDAQGESPAFGGMAVLAPHGGGIERGTSELCLAVAGYRPADLTPLGGPLYDYWMFEGLLADRNARLHVTSTHCDDPVALALAGGSRTALSLHGCTAGQAGATGDRRAVVIGGRDAEFRRVTRTALQTAGFQVVDGAGVPSLAGQAADNLVNRTLSGAGVQLELTTELRDAMFAPGKNTVAARAANTTGTFDAFVRAIRTAIATRDRDPNVRVRV